MLDSTNLVLESFLETQLKLKILYSSNTLYSEDIKSLSEIKKNTIKLVLKVLNSISLKKVLSSKITNRIVLKYFKNFISASSYQNPYDLRCNKITLDKCYLNTVAINSLYEFYNKEPT